MVVMVVVASSWLVVLLLNAAPSHGGVGAHGKSDSEDKVQELLLDQRDQGFDLAELACLHYTFSL